MVDDAKPPGGALPPTVAELKAEIESLRAQLGATSSKDDAAALRKEIELLKAELAEVRKMDKLNESGEIPIVPPKARGWSDHFIT